MKSNMFNEIQAFIICFLNEHYQGLSLESQMFKKKKRISNVHLPIMQKGSHSKGPGGF